MSRKTKRPQGALLCLASPLLRAGLAVVLLAVGCTQESSRQDASTTQVKLVESAVDVCSAEEVYPIGCAPSIWSACFAQQEEAARGVVARYLCDSAVMAETGELAFALAYRYGREFYPSASISSDGRFRGDGELPAFYLFHESLRYWLAYLSLSPASDGMHHGVIDFGWLRTQRGRFMPLGGFSQVSDAELVQLKSLEEAIDGLYSPYSAYSPSKPNWHMNSPDMSSFETPSLTASSSVPPSEVIRACQDAMTAARLSDPIWRTDIQRCLTSAEACDKDRYRTEYALRQECSEAALAADFESRWQMLPHVCLAAGKVTDMDSLDDPCSEAAEELCHHPRRLYQGFSPREAPDNPAEDFTCAAARIDPLLLFQQPLPEERHTGPIANDDEIFGGLNSWIRIDVLANDADVEGDFDHFTLAIVESKRPRRGTARVIHIPQGLPVIEYRPISISAGEHDTFSYVICDDLSVDFNRCVTAEVTVAYPDCTITGTPGNDSLVGTPGDDVICGMDGDDIINGQAGNDLIHAGRGADIIYSGTGDDTIFGGPGNDLIFGHRGHDTIFGGLGSDRLYGGEGGDTIYGGEETDEIYGEAGNDTLHGDDDPDRLYGGQGNDTLHGGYGNDTIRGGEGADIIYPSIFVDTILDPSEEDAVY